MLALRLDHVLEWLTGPGLVLVFGVLWAGLGLFTIGLFALVLTRWGRSRALLKCLVLSLLAHLLLVCYSVTVKIYVAVVEQAEKPAMSVAIDEGEKPASDGDPAYSDKPWESFAKDVASPQTADMARQQTPDTPQPKREPAADPAAIPNQTPLENLRPADAVTDQPRAIAEEAPRPRATAGRAPEALEAPAAQRREAARTNVPVAHGPGRDPSAAGTQTSPVRTSAVGLPSALLQAPAPLPRMSDAPTSPEPGGVPGPFADLQAMTPRGSPAPSVGAQPDLVGGPTGAGSPGAGAADSSGRLAPPSLAALAARRPSDGVSGDLSASGSALVGPPVMPRTRPGSESGVPDIYKLRTAPNRAELAEKQGATQQTEEAVKAALKWLADNQEPDGRWDASRHGAGRELQIDGRDRQGAGAGADTAATGLALLTFLASGHTHLEGDYQEHVRRGLEFLIRAQGPDGNLGGRASAFAFMYSHAIGALALSEAYAMTRDRDTRLREPVRRAIAYTLAAQSTETGGWRYKPGDPGDTSQLGWQLMALKSAEFAGLTIPDQAKQGAARYLRSVSLGRAGGLAAYRPTEKATRPMTAEALVCRQFLGAPPSDPACREAGEHLLLEMPGRGEANLYYWYYGTLGMYQLQGAYWRQWNEQLQAVLLARQQKSGPLAGSWNPDTRWDNYGGRVYSTALSALCLEMPYRFLPLYAIAAPAPGGPR